MKKQFWICLLLLTTAFQSKSQVINQLTITPPNPTATDTITVIWDLTYTGNCAFGMVSVYSFVNDSTITIAPTYCGYNDTTVCNTVDTFRIGPFATGNYTIHMEIHQGSVCPFSGFDATITQFDTSIVVTPVSGIVEHPQLSSSIISSNPASSQLNITLPSKSKNTKIHIFDLNGKLLKEVRTNEKIVSISTRDFSEGIYLLKIQTTDFMEMQRIIVTK